MSNEPTSGDSLSPAPAPLKEQMRKLISDTRTDWLSDGPFHIRTTGAGPRSICTFCDAIEDEHDDDDCIWVALKRMCDALEVSALSPHPPTSEAFPLSRILSIKSLLKDVDRCQHYGAGPHCTCDESKIHDDVALIRELLGSPHPPSEERK